MALGRAHGAHALEAAGLQILTVATEIRAVKRLNKAKASGAEMLELLQVTW